MRRLEEAKVDNKGDVSYQDEAKAKLKPNTDSVCFRQILSILKHFHRSQDANENFKVHAMNQLKGSSFLSFQAKQTSALLAALHFAKS